MTLSYSIGLTGGSVAAYVLDSLMGPHPIHDRCVPTLNDTDYHFLYNISAITLPQLIL